MQEELFPLQDPEADGRETLSRVVSARQPSHVFALFSGGHDSLCSTHLAMTSGLATAAVHINTEVGIEATRQFARDTCAAYGWPLIELRPPRPPFKARDGTLWGEPGQTAYEAMVMRWGFPGPKGHSVMYQRLKERCLRQLEREHRTARRPLVLVTGVRRQESRRRMGHIVAEQVEGRRVWCAPLVDWSERDKERYIARHSLPVNQIAKRLCMSGECLCGAFARPEERAELRAVCPEVDAYLVGLEAQVEAAGVGRCRWGQKPPPGRRKKPPPGRRKRAAHGPFLPLCVACEAKAERMEGAQWWTTNG